jgi:ribosome-binding protein aMBF1 (putative translation factor)
LTQYVRLPIPNDEVNVPKTYDEIVQARRARMPAESDAVRAVFEQSYDLALALIQLRERHGFTQIQLAERCGVNQADISRIERGSTSPTARTLQRIADALADVRLVERAAS